MYSWLVRYGSAIVAVAAALAIAVVFQHEFGQATLFALTAAITSAALYGGGGPALLAIALSGLGAGFLLFRPTGSLAVGGDPLPRFALFIATG